MTLLHDNESDPSDQTRPAEYVVFPSADTPTIAPFRVNDDSAVISLFSDNKWSFDALDTPDRHRYSINFDLWPEGFQLFAKHTTYALINYGNPPLLIELEGNYSKWPAAGSIYNGLGYLRTAVNWLVGPWSDANPMTPVVSPADLDSEHLNDVKNWIDGREDIEMGNADRLEILLRAWYLNPWLPPEQQWPEPIWKDENWRPRRTLGENNSRRLSQQTMGPLLEWAVAFVSVIAPDIFTAQKHYDDQRSLIAPTRGSGSACTQLLDDYVRLGIPLPVTIVNSQNGPLARISWRSLAYKHGLNAQRLDTAYWRHAERERLVISDDFALTKVNVEIRGQFHSKSWIPFISVHDLHANSRPSGIASSPLLRHLRTACLIVLAYLTGARPEEVLALKVGAAPGPTVTPGGSRLHLIRGLVWKGIPRQPDGKPPVPRAAAWVTLEVSSTAVHILESMAALDGSQGQHLFGVNGRPPHSSTGSKWIMDFIAFVNERLVPHSVNASALTIPPDPDGKVTLRRFRRTLAWHIRNQPNGEVVLAIQYQHLSEVIGWGYAGTQQSGLTDLLAEEDWLHRKATVSHLADLFEEGQGISGPAASRVIKAVQKLPRFLTPADERRLRKDPDMEIYDNSASLTLCAWNLQTALCHPLNALNSAHPNLLGCVVGCKNRARTDGQLDELGRQADSLRAQAQISPLPIAQSMLAEAESRDRQIEQFQTDRIVPDPGLPGEEPE